MSNTVKVCVRIRPLSDNELQRGDGLSAYAANNQTVKLMNNISNEANNNSNNNNVDTSTYHFDQVFGPDASQQDVFDRGDIPNLCEAALNGLGVTVFVYGISTGGKTHTISGPPSSNVVWNSDTGKISELFNRYLISTENNMSSTSRIDPRYEEVFQNLGLQFRAGVHLLRRVQAILDEEERMKKRNHDNNTESSSSSITIRAAMYEIYNEQVNDLLNETTNLKVRLSSTSHSFFVENLMLVSITSMEDLFAVLAQGESSRKRSNHSDSTRSHVIFSLAVERQQEVVNDVDGTISYLPLIGKMNFVDLAGSERLSNSVAYNALSNNTSAAAEQTSSSRLPSIAEKFGPQNAQIQQHQTELLEARKINQSLLVLGKVISALAANTKTNNFANLQHIPFRDSTLTKLLMDSLSGQAVTLMIACVSPSSRFLEESKNTMQYATMARSISGYNNHRHHVTSKVDAGRGEVTQLRKEVEFLRRENFSMRKQLIVSNGEKQRLKRQLEQVLNLNPDCASQRGESFGRESSNNTNEENLQKHFSGRSFDGELASTSNRINEDEEEVPKELQSRSSILYVNNANNNQNQNQLTAHNNNDDEREQEDNDDNNNDHNLESPRPSTREGSSNFNNGTQNSSTLLDDTLRKVEHDNQTLKNEVEELKKLVLDISRRASAAMSVGNILTKSTSQVQQVTRQEAETAVAVEKVAPVIEAKPPAVQENTAETKPVLAESPQQQQQQQQQQRQQQQQPFYGFIPAAKKSGNNRIVLKASKQSEEKPQQQQQEQTVVVRQEVAKPIEPEKKSSEPVSLSGSVLRPPSASARALPLSLGSLAFDAVKGDV